MYEIYNKTNERNYICRFTNIIRVVVSLMLQSELRIVREVWKLRNKLQPLSLMA